VVPGDPNWRWYYLTFTSTLPASYAKVQEIIDIWAAQHTSGSFVRTPAGFELKAKYHKDYRNGILILWLNFDGVERKGYGIFKNAAALIMAYYDLRVVVSDDRYSFDYEWSNPGYFRQHDYYRYEKSYVFYKREGEGHE
jgi:hypothetical protein